MANIAKDVKTRPAGINGKFEIAVMDINHVVENNKTVLKAKGVKIPNLSNAHLPTPKNASIPKVYVIKFVNVNLYPVKINNIP